MTAFCAAVDWGTSSFRLWLLDRTGSPLVSRRSDEGMTACTPDRFGTVLAAHLDAIGASPALPVIVCGMAGARQGWKEAAYIETPAALSAIPHNAVSVPSAGREVRILPGIACRIPASADVMRGEETQLLGLADTGTEDMVVCMPGTHSKWIVVERGTVTAFRTYMTGELFATIGGHTILSHALKEDGQAFSQAAFEIALRSALDDPAALTASLFSIRARGLLGFSEAGDAGATVSGLLIGAEIAAETQRTRPVQSVRLLATGALRQRYESALALAGIAVEAADAEAAVIGGLFKAATALWEPNREEPT